MKNKNEVYVHKKITFHSKVIFCKFYYKTNYLASQIVSTAEYAVTVLLSSSDHLTLSLTCVAVALQADCACFCFNLEPKD